MAVLQHLTLPSQIIMFMSIDKGEHIKTNKFHMFKCKELLLSVSDGLIDSSGEILDASTIHIISVGDAVRFVY